jgi:3-methyl-2-oxobutanoate hydroxymethyltransferase
MITAYDCASAQHAEVNACSSAHNVTLRAQAAAIDISLVGDSAANVVNGHKSTTGITMSEMIQFSKNVVMQSKKTFVVGDLPFGSYTSDAVGVENAVRFLKEAGVDAVKLEGGKRMASVVRAIRDVGINVIGHCGVLPQTVAEVGGFRVVGRDAATAAMVYEDCLAIEQAGACAIVLEMVSAPVAGMLTRALRVPTIGIGSGAACDGQVLVYHDALALLRGGHAPTFAKQYAQLGDTATRALSEYRREVTARDFPSPRHSFPSAALPADIGKAIAARGLAEPAAHVLVPRSDDAIDSSLRPPTRVLVVGGGALGSLTASLIAHRLAGSRVALLSAHTAHIDAISQQRALTVRTLAGESIKAPVVALDATCVFVSLVVVGLTLCVRAQCN